ncbi:MAG: dynamin family protein [Vicinamibacterales bacterium]
MKPPVLDAARQALLDDTRRLVDEAAQRLLGLELDAGTRKALADAREQIAQPFLLVVVGEFNTGKSSFINALLGRRLLDEGMTPTTSQVAIVRYGEVVSRHERIDGVIEVTAPAELLRALAIVDTPGTNAVLREHEALTRDFLPRADLVVFLTAADRPYTESERAFLEAIREWGKSVVVVLNRADQFGGDAQAAEVVAFVREQAAPTLGTTPEVFPVSARDALEARASGADADRLERSGLVAFEARLARTLDERERFRLKLRNPLGIARRALAEAGGRVDRQLALLEGDRQALEAIEGQASGHAAGVARDFQLRLADVEKPLFEFERRGAAFFDERLRLGRFRELLDRERLHRDFVSDVVAALPHEVERRVDGLVDFLVESELDRWQDVMAILAERPAARAGSEGRVEDRFEWNRAELIARVGAAAREVVEHYDARSEARRLAEKVRESVAQAALLQVSALGLGTLVAVLASTTAADVTGLVAAGALSLIGLFLLPARREKARRELAARVSQLREKLVSSLTAAFEAERAHAAGRIREAMAPYESFVRREGTRLDEARGDLRRLSDAVEGLLARIDRD